MMYTESERKSYIREYLSSGESKGGFCRRTGLPMANLIRWQRMYDMKEKKPSTPAGVPAPSSRADVESLKAELARLRKENRTLRNSLAEESLRLEACELLIDLAESTYHIKVRKNSGAK